jgi:hypothetical protein
LFPADSAAAIERVTERYRRGHHARLLDAVRLIGTMPN